MQAQEATNEAGSVILAESPLSMPESSLTLEQSPRSIRNILSNHGNDPRTGECLEMSSTSPGSNSPEVSSSLEKSLPPRGSKTSERNQEIHIPVIRTPSCEQMQNKVAMTTGEATTGLAAVNDGAVLAENQETRNFEALGSFRSKETVIDTIQRVTTSEGYLQPVDNNNVQAGHGKARVFSPSHPRAKPRVKKSGTRDRKKDISMQQKFTKRLGQLNTDKLQNNPLYRREAPIQQCSCVRPVDQSNRLVSPAVGTRIGHQGYQNCINNNNDRSTTAPYSLESPYMQVLQTTNWEVSRDHLSLFERIGGGSFGQVWRGAVFDLSGDKEWSAVAVKMLKGNLATYDSQMCRILL